jgi:lipopolysaccharide transport system permease protein
MVTPLLRYRGLIWQNAVADVRHRYAGTSLGVVWNVLHPLAMIAVYSIIFSQVMKPQLPGLHGPFAYALYLCSGFLPWLAFSECLTRGANAFTENAVYLKKLPIPEPVFAAQAAASATIGLGISFSLLLTISLAMGHRPTIWWLLLPLPLISLQALGFGLGLLLGTINVFLRDVGQLLQVALQVAMWTVPIVYLAETLPAWARHLLAWHPVAPALLLIRDLFLYGHNPDATRDAVPITPATWAALFVWPAATLAFAWFVFGKLRKEIRDVL